MMKIKTKYNKFAMIKLKLNIICDDKIKYNKF